jgi:hypothetical protein
LLADHVCHPERFRRCRSLSPRLLSQRLVGVFSLRTPGVRGVLLEAGLNCHPVAYISTLRAVVKAPTFGPWLLLCGGCVNPTSAESAMFFQSITDLLTSLHYTQKNLNLPNTVFDPRSTLASSIFLNITWSKLVERFKWLNYRTYRQYPRNKRGGQTTDNRGCQREPSPEF